MSNYTYCSRIRDWLTLSEHKNCDVRIHENDVALDRFGNLCIVYVVESNQNFVTVQYSDGKLQTWKDSALFKVDSGYWAENG